MLACKCGGDSGVDGDVVWGFVRSGETTAIVFITVCGIVLSGTLGEHVFLVRRDSLGPRSDTRERTCTGAMIVDVQTNLTSSARASDITPAPEDVDAAEDIAATEPEIGRSSVEIAEGNSTAR
eukprot:1995138-Rhodomonas_salina.1